ncbi:uncharacterized protein LOC133530921 [Cydia pomonella]|uniref:uncharacterized protein LOC133530921 n=1 Tax=Cydia pomonella TaxID=82600 RepID=UPI002ADD5080|nr:uncharacterized protein LOC133530921 [Cydia pomonella]
MSHKRERSINFTSEEVDILIKLVEVNKHILENKKSDAVTWGQKEKCWRAIALSFNAESRSTHRTSKNLRLKYEGIKRDIRKKAALIRAGGPSAAPVFTPTESKVKDMILLSVDGMENNFDSDSLPNIVADTQDAADLGEASSETLTKRSQWKPASLRLRKQPALCKPKSKRPFENIADSKMEITVLQKQILEEEYVNKKLQWAFEEEERQHKREMWALEKMVHDARHCPYLHVLARARKNIIHLDRGILDQLISRFL